MTTESYSSVYNGVSEAVSSIKQLLKDAIEVHSEQVDAFCADKPREDILKELLGNTVAISTYAIPSERNKNDRDFLADVAAERIVNCSNTMTPLLELLADDPSNIAVIATRADSTLGRLQELGTLISKLAEKLPNVMQDEAVNTNIAALLKGASCLKEAIAAACQPRENSNSD